MALPSCQAELYLAHCLMVERMYLRRLCNLLCKDDVAMNNGMVQQKPYTESSFGHGGGLGS